MILNVGLNEIAISIELHRAHWPPATVISCGGNQERGIYIQRSQSCPTDNSRGFALTARFGPVVVASRSSQWLPIATPRSDKNHLDHLGVLEELDEGNWRRTCQEITGQGSVVSSWQTRANGLVRNGYHHIVRIFRLLIRRGRFYS